MVFPVYWMVTTAFKQDSDINSYDADLGAAPRRRSLTSARRSPDPTTRTSGTPSINSLIVVSITVALSMVLAFLAAVALAKFRFTGREVFIVLIIGIQMLPQVGLIIPLYIVLRNYHLTENATSCSA